MQAQAWYAFPNHSQINLLKAENTQVRQHPWRDDCKHSVFSTDAAFITLVYNYPFPPEILMYGI